MNMRIPNSLREWLLDRCLKVLSSRKPDFLIGPPGDPYIKRTFLIPRNMFFNIYIHEIRHDDEDRALHDHPAINISIIVDVGYIEITPLGKFIRQAGEIILRRSRSLHRLVVHRNPDGSIRPAITIWVSGPKFRWADGKFRRNWWGFACPKKWVHWEDFTDARDRGQVGKGCGEYS